MDAVRLGERSLLERLRAAEHAVFLMGQGEAIVEKQVTDLRRKSVLLESEKHVALRRRMRRAENIRAESKRIEDEAKKNLQKDLLTNHYQLIAKFRTPVRA